MNKFVKTIALFSLPFIVLIVSLFYIDPYNIIREEENISLLKLKNQISYKINYPLYKLQEYNYTPTDIIVLGDSRANHLSPQTFDSIANEKVTNLAYGGGTIQEIVETFWIANSMHKLKKVYIGINFNLYNALNAKNTVKEANRLRNSSLSYLTSKYCIKSSFLIMKSLISEENIEIEKPPFSREEFWQYQLNQSGPNFYENYIYPSIEYGNLREISQYCQNNNIELVFFIPPTHIDLQNKIKEYHLEKENDQFKKDLKALNMPLFDFNFENSKTTNKEYFSDPFHFTNEFEEIIIRIISSNNLKIQNHKNVYKSL